MVKKIKTTNSLLQSFFDKTNKHLEIIGELNKGASTGSIGQLEVQLNIKLPTLYKEFLQTCNDRRLFSISGTILWEAYDNGPDNTDTGTIYLNEGNKPVHRGNIPLNLFIIAATGKDDIICINLDKSDGYDGEVVKCSYKTGEVSMHWDKLVDWLSDEWGYVMRKVILDSSVINNGTKEVTLEYEQDGKTYKVVMDRAEYFWYVIKYVYNRNLVVQNIQTQPYKEDGFWMGRPYLPFTVFVNRITDSRLHWHTYLEFLYILNGKSVITIDKEKYDAAPGDLLIINSGEYHAVQSLENYSEFIVIQFEPQVLNSNSGYVYEFRDIVPFLQKEIDYSKHIKLENGCELEIILREMVDDFNSIYPGYELNIKAGIYRIFSWLIKHNHINVHFGKGLKISDAESLKGLLKYIEENYFEEITVESAARVACMSYHHFCRLFKKVTRKTFMEYLNSIRLHEAEKLLLSTDENILEIALKVGFANVNHFERLFKDEKGLSPFKYRRENIENNYHDSLKNEHK